MKNTLVIDRARFDQLSDSYYGRTLLFLDFYIVEEADGSATFIKNRSNSQRFYSKEEYQTFKAEMSWK